MIVYCCSIADSKLAQCHCKLCEAVIASANKKYYMHIHKYVDIIIRKMFCWGAQVIIVMPKIWGL
jgi:hypothetical protein